MTKHRHLSKNLTVGVGGIGCSCCFPPPGKRKHEFRSAKRKDKIEAFKVSF